MPKNLLSPRPDLMHPIVSDCMTNKACYRLCGNCKQKTEAQTAGGGNSVFSCSFSVDKDTCGQLGNSRRPFNYYTIDAMH